MVYIISLKGTKSLRRDGRDMVFSASILLSVFVFFWAYNVVAEELARGFDAFSSTALLFAMPVATGAMLISIFQGTAMAVTFSLIIAVLSSLLTGGRVEFFLYFFVSSIVAAYGVKHCHERVILIKTGLMVGLINTALAVAVIMIYGSLYSFEALTAAACGFFGGLLSGVIATGILPLIELSFGFTTDIKLLELVPGWAAQPQARDANALQDCFGDKGMKERLSSILCLSFSLILQLGFLLKLYRNFLFVFEKRLIKNIIRIIEMIVMAIAA